MEYDNEEYDDDEDENGKYDSDDDDENGEYDNQAISQWDEKKR